MVGQKGDCCCCGKCYYKYACGLNDCCYCIPNRLCVTLEMLDAETSCGDCTCIKKSVLLNWDCGTEEYTTTLVCGSLSVDLSFTIQKNAQNECVFCLTSTCLGLDCTNDGAKIMALPLGAPEDEYGPKCRSLSATWTVDTSTCDTGSVPLCGTATITTVVPDYFFPYAIFGGCSPECTGCGCICKNICVNYVKADTNEDCEPCSVTTELTWDDACACWEGSVSCDGVTVDIKLEIVDCGAANCCLRLTNLSTGASFPDQVLSCSSGDIDATFSATTVGNIQHTFAVTCKKCKSCVTESDDCPTCCDSLDRDCDQYPTLTATLTSACGALNNVVIPLLYANCSAPISCHCWSGTVNVSCGITLPVTFILRCEGGGADCSDDVCTNYVGTLAYTASGCGGGGTLHPETCTCDPPSFQWTDFTSVSEDIPGAGCTCCSGEDVTVTVTL